MSLRFLELKTFVYTTNVTKSEIGRDFYQLLQLVCNVKPRSPREMADRLPSADPYVVIYMMNLSDNIADI